MSQAIRPCFTRTQSLASKHLLLSISDAKIRQGFTTGTNFRSCGQLCKKASFAGRSESVSRSPNRKWEEQDSNLRRLSQQIYSLSRLTASVPSRGDFVKNPRYVFLSLRVYLDLVQLFQFCTAKKEPAEGLEPTTCCLQNSCSAN